MELKNFTDEHAGQAGYQHTEFGLIPSDWNIQPLIALAEKVMVGIASAATHAYRDRGVLMFRNQNIKPGHLDDADVLFISEDYELTFKNKRLKAGDLLTARTGYPGTTSLVPAKYEGSQSFTTLITRPKKAAVNPEFLCCFINSEAGLRYFASAQIGGGQKNVNAASMKQLPVLIPDDILEQKAIATALMDANALIQSLGHLLTKKRQIKQGAMQELLTGERRLPAFSDPWQPSKLEDLADIRSGGTPSTQNDQFWDGDVLWCTPTDITALNGSKYLADTQRKITLLGLRACSAELIPPHSIVMTSRATIGECAINVVPVSTNQGFKNFVPFEHVDADFLFYLLTTQKAGFISLCGGSTFLEIGKTQLRPYEVLMPPTKDEQTAIAMLLSDMDAEITALEARLTKARHLKQGMAQALLTGRIRLVPRSGA